MLEQFHVPEQDRVYIEVDRMRAATEALFMRCGVDEAGAKASTDVLLTNDLRAVETHGVSNMMRNYVASIYGRHPQPDTRVEDRPRNRHHRKRRRRRSPRHPNRRRHDADRHRQSQDNTEPAQLPFSTPATSADADTTPLKPPSKAWSVYA